MTKHSICSDFYGFRSKLHRVTFQAAPITSDQSVNSEKFHIQLFKGDYKGVHFPVNFSQTDGEKMSDILDTGYAGLYLVSEKLVSILRDYQFSGWSLYPINIQGNKSQVVESYYGFSVTGKSSEIDYAKSEIVEKRWVEGGPLNKCYKGIVVDEWDESDFFSPEGTLYTFVTNRVATTLKKHMITNLRLEHLNTMETSCL